MGMRDVQLGTNVRASKEVWASNGSGLMSGPAQVILDIPNVKPKLLPIPIRIILVFATLLGICVPTSAQLNENFSEVLNEVFSNKDIATLTYVQFPKSKSTAFVFNNEVVVTNAANYYETFFKVYETDSVGARVFSTSFGEVRFFAAAEFLDMVTNHEVHKVVVIDKFHDGSKGLDIVFHTTSLDPKSWYAISGKHTAFHKVSVSFKRIQGKLVQVGIKIKPIGHKPIVD